MISRLLTLIGMCFLLAGAGAAGFWAFTVKDSQSPLPRFDMATPQSVPTTAPRQTARPGRPDVFYQAIEQRPLFAPDRRPASPEPDPAPVPQPAIVVEETPPPPPPAPNLRLLGVMGTAQNNRALVQNGQGDTLWLTPGTTLGGWTITRIGPDWLDLSRETETLRIEMYQ